MAWRVIFQLLPSFFSPQSPRLENEGSSTAAEPVRSSRNVGLDGLRGLGALSVTTLHICYGFNETMLVGDGVPFEMAKYCGIHIDQQHYRRRSRLVQMPFLRLLYNGSAAVAVFFVISGCVLTVRPLKLARKRQWDLLLSTLSSAAFRRPFRLLLPLIVVSFIRMIFTYLKLMDGSLNDENFIVAVWEPPVLIAENLPKQFMHWLKTIWLTLNVWDWKTYNSPYDIHLWTINAELRASLAIFLVTLALCKLRTRFSLMAICLLIIHTLLWARWDMSLFLGGMLFAQISTTSGFDTPSVNPRSIGFAERQQRYRFHKALMRLLYYILLLIATYLLSTPLLCSAHTPGYDAFAAILPRSLYPSLIEADIQLHHMIGAFILVGLIVLWKPQTLLTELLESRAAQYLGRISYSLYIVHGPLLHLFGYRTLSFIWTLTGQDTFVKSATGWLIGYCLTMSLLIWIADLVCRGIDEPLVRFTRQEHKRMTDRKNTV